MTTQSTHARASSATKTDAQGRKEVRAGPGDAGRQDRAERLPERPGDRKKGVQAIRLFAILCVIGALVWLVLQFAA